MELLRELVELESPTGHSDGVRAVGARVARELEACGGEPRFLGDHVRVDFPGEGEPLLVLGHCDTVWPLGTLERMPFRVEDACAYGPGSYDMKAGLVVIVAAIRSAPERRRPLCVFLTGDEEAGSLSARPLIEDTARGAAAAFVTEPPTAGGDLKTARKGLGRYRLVVTGAAAHAAASGGVSAIEELAHQIVRLHALQDPARGIKVNVGVVKGGTRENVVAAHAEAWIDVRAEHVDDQRALDDHLRSLETVLDGTRLELEGGITRPPLEPTPATERLLAKAREHGRSLGLDLHGASSGGGSDGNLVAAVGVPVLDGLGAEGSGAHAEHERVLVESLPVRSQLLARLLEEPGLDD